MAILIKYVGSADNYAELPITGKQSVWQVGQQEERPDSESALLLSTGLFSTPPQDVTAITNPLTGRIEKCESAGVNLNTIYSDQITDGYHCHLWSGSSGNGDEVVPDISGSGRHGTFHTNMTKAMAWANPGFASTDIGGNYRTFLLPNLNYDYASGESIIVVWKGRGTPPAAGWKAIVADSAGSSEAGFALRVNTTGNLQPYLSDGTGRFLDPSSEVALEPTVTHTFAIMIDGLNRKYEMHVDGVVYGGGGMGGQLIGGGQAYDTRSAKPLKLGTQDDFGTASNTLDLKTQALVILRGRIGLGMPTNYRELMRSIARQPDRLVTKAWW